MSALTLASCENPFFYCKVFTEYLVIYFNIHVLNNCIIEENKKSKHYLWITLYIYIRCIGLLLGIVNRYILIYIVGSLYNSYVVCIVYTLRCYSLVIIIHLVLILRKIPSYLYTIYTYYIYTRYPRNIIIGNRNQKSVEEIGRYLYYILYIYYISVRCRKKISNTL